MSFSRRMFLAGVGGAAVSLPLLEVMGGNRARAGTPETPLRYLVCFAGASLGNGRGEMFTPSTAGTAWELTRALRPLGGRALNPMWDWDDVKADVSIVSGMRIPYGNATEAPAGGRITNWHATSLGPIFTGVRSLRPSQYPRGESSDQIVANAIGGDTRLRSLVYKVQASSYRGGTSLRNRMSYAQDASGAVVPVDPIVSPQLAFDQLFRGFVPSDPAEADAAARLTRRDRTVLDLVRRSTERLRSKLGTADLDRLERHFDEIRDLEMRISEIPETTSTCVVPSRPGADPPIELSSSGVVDGEEKIIGWSNEDQRARVMFEMVRMAFACDLTRVASVMITDSQSHLSVERIMGLNSDVHELGHGEGPEEMADIIGWHVGHLARLISDMKNTPDGDGSLLDHTAIVFLTEGGHGFDPESGNNSSHSSEDMACLVAGRAGGLVPGQHIRARDRHPAEVVAAAMRAVGVDHGGLGEVDGHIEALFG